MCTLKNLQNFQNYFILLPKLSLLFANKRMNTLILFYLIKANMPGDALSLLLLDGVILKFESYVKTLISKNKNIMANKINQLCRFALDFQNFSIVQNKIMWFFFKDNVFCFHLVNQHYITANLLYVNNSNLHIPQGDQSSKPWRRKKKCLYFAIKLFAIRMPYTLYNIKFLYGFLENLKQEI